MGLDVKKQRSLGKRFCFVDRPQKLRDKRKRTISHQWSQWAGDGLSFGLSMVNV